MDPDGKQINLEIWTATGSGKMDVQLNNSVT
jgi:hypothetical protein